MHHRQYETRYSILFARIVAREDLIKSWRELQLSLAFDRQPSSTLIDFELVQILMS